MYVCLCNRYRDSEIREAANQGCRTAEEAYAAMGNGPRCGRCVPMAQELIDSVAATAPARASA